MIPAAPTLGFYASVAAFVAIVGYGVAQSLQVLGYIDYPLADILIYATSLCITVPFLLALLALHETADVRKRLWTRGALLFGVIYVTYAALVYVVQLSVVMPKSLDSPPTGLLAVSPQSLFWDIDGLAYIAMGIAAALAALALPRGGTGAWARHFLLAHGLITPIIAFIYLYPHFSIALLLLGSPWLITAPGSMLALAYHFNALERAAAA